MNSKVVLEELIKFSKECGIKVIRDTLSKSRGGACILKNENIIVLNKFFPIERQASLLARCLGEINPPQLESMKDQKLQKYIIDEYGADKTTPIEFNV
ncbi:MAG: hypothetical protein IJK61_02150 [Bacteroidetes bacterium]|nr:hypothetical protein [Bacteroidota bacterium]